MHPDEQSVCAQKKKQIGRGREGEGKGREEKRTDVGFLFAPVAQCSSIYLTVSS
jgi:hypothetical protein